MKGDNYFLWRTLWLGTLVAKKQAE